MNIRTVIVFVACAFYTSAFAVHALAMNQSAGHAPSEQTLTLMKLEFATMEQTGDPTGIGSKTKELIGALLSAQNHGAPESLQAASANFAAAINGIDEQQLVEECKDALLTGLFYSGWSLVQTLAGGGDQLCLTLSAGGIIADILITLQSYQLCTIDNSEVPDEALRETICQQQTLVETYDFIAGWMYATRCSSNTSFATYLTLIINFLTVFTVCS